MITEHSMNDNRGPIEILCKEIGIRFDRKLETREMLVAFVSVLVSHIAGMRALQVQIVPMGGPAPSTDSEKVLSRVTEMLASNDYDELIPKAAAIHDYIHQVAPDEAVPCDHLIDMLSSCVSALRFGLEKPCHSRHAAEAAFHVWKHLYGIRLFDGFTPSWEKEWTRAQFHAAMVARIA